MIKKRIEWKLFYNFPQFFFHSPFPWFFSVLKNHFVSFHSFFYSDECNVQCRSPALNCIICVLRSLLVQWILLRIHEWACDTSETRILSRIGFLYFTLIYFEKKEKREKVFPSYFFFFFCPHHLFDRLNGRACVCKWTNDIPNWPLRAWKNQWIDRKFIR